MSKDIVISDDVYEKLKREKGDRSFSEVIADHLDSGGRLEDVAGQQVLDPDIVESVTDDIDTLSEDPLDRAND